MPLIALPGSKIPGHPPRVISWPFICLLLLAASAALYASSYIYDQLCWCDVVADNTCFALGRGRIVVVSSVALIGGSSMACQDLATPIACDKTALFPRPLPFRTTGAITVIPLLPFMAAFALPPFLFAKVYQRRKFWRHVTPSVPLLLIALGLNGTAIRTIGEQSGKRNLAMVGMIVEAVGYLSCFPICVVWAVFLRGNIRRSRVAREDPNRCKTCDYSLRGLSEHRCPECGTPFAPM